jgi:DNA-binding SARP family transcriptional activator/streptogramin lyase
VRFQASQAFRFPCSCGKTDEVEYRVLGPLEVVDGNGPIALGRLKEHLVLAVLLLHANEVVSRDRLIDELWGEAPPPTAKKAVNLYVSKLRKTLTHDGADPIQTVPGGYRLSVEPAELDVTRAQQQLTRARESASTGELETASELFRQALTLWRGRTLAGLELESVGRHEIEQLDELWLTGLMDRIDCDLALGRHEQLIGELNRLVGEHPLRERLRAQQMLALYRADRQAEALDAYQQARQALVDDLGIEPSEALQRLQKGILAHDPALEIPTGVGVRNGSTTPSEPAVTAPEPPPPPPAPRSRFRPSRRHIVLAAAVAALALAGTLTAMATRASGHQPPPKVEANSLVQLDPSTGRVVSVVPVGVEPGPIAITPKAIWTANYGDNTVSRYDLRTHTVEARAGFPAQPFDTVIDGDGNAWITSSYEGLHPDAKNAFLTRLEAGPGGTSAGTLYPSHAQTIDLPLPMAGYETLGAGYLWVIVGGHGPLPGDDRVALVDLSTNQVASVTSLHDSATYIAFGYGSAWIGTYTPGGNSWLEAIRAGNSKPTKVVLQENVNWGPTSIAVGEGAVWVITNRASGSGQRPVLFEIDPQTLQVVHSLDLTAEQHGAVAVGAGAVWTTGGISGGNTRRANSVTKIDPRNDRIIRTYPLGNRTRVTCGIAATPSAVWVTLGNTSCDTIGQ